jgi:membrane complex biogenesis BtpA family protein
MRLDEIFSVRKPIIGMLHLDYLAGQPEYRGFEYTLSRALFDLYNLQDGGIDGILIENWKEYTTTPEANPQNVDCMLEISKELAKRARVPLGINVLNNDYKAAFKIAKEIGAKFVQLDVFVDKVRTEFEFNPYTKQNPFDVIVDPKDVLKYKPESIALFVFIQPKHYVLLEKDKPIELSARQAIENKADAVIVTGERTGIAPSIEKIRKVKQAIENYPVGIGSGFSSKNARYYLPEVDFVIVGTDLKYEGETDNPVDIRRVEEIIKIAAEFR